MSMRSTVVSISLFPANRLDLWKCRGGSGQVDDRGAQEREKRRWGSTFFFPLRSLDSAIRSLFTTEADSNDCIGCLIGVRSLREPQKKIKTNKQTSKQTNKKSQFPSSNPHSLSLYALRLSLYSAVSCAVLFSMAEQIAMEERMIPSEASLPLPLSLSDSAVAPSDEMTQLRKSAANLLFDACRLGQVELVGRILAIPGIDTHSLSLDTHTHSLSLSLLLCLSVSSFFDIPYSFSLCNCVTHTHTHTHTHTLISVLLFSPSLSLSLSYFSLCSKPACLLSVSLP